MYDRVYFLNKRLFVSVTFALMNAVHLYKQRSISVPPLLLRDGWSSEAERRPSSLELHRVGQGFALESPMRLVACWSRE